MGKKILLFLGGVATGVAGTLGTCAIVKCVKSKKESKYTEVPKKAKIEEVKTEEKKPDKEKK